MDCEKLRPYNIAYIVSHLIILAMLVLTLSICSFLRYRMNSDDTGLFSPRQYAQMKPAILEKETIR